MTLPIHINSLEKNKFEETAGGKVAVRTIPSGVGSIDPLAKFIEVVQTSTTVETYNYYESNSKVTLYNTITVTYTDATRAILDSVEWS